MCMCVIYWCLFVLFLLLFAFLSVIVWALLSHRLFLPTSVLQIHQKLFRLSFLDIRARLEQTSVHHSPPDSLFAGSPLTELQPVSKADLPTFGDRVFQILKMGSHTRLSLSPNRLDGLVVKASVLRAEDPWFESLLRRFFFFWVESYQ